MFILCLMRNEVDLLDNNNRSVSYLRISVTDRCNLRCIYCMPQEGVNFLPHGEILNYEEIFRIVRLCVQSGIRKVRLTGGEPLIRKGIIPFIERLCEIKQLEEIVLTTNGVLLKELARDLHRCGICRINVSMDTLRPERFLKITRRDFFDQVWEGIEEASFLGMNPIKINVVAIGGVNDDELLDFARMTYFKPYQVRFIELMPIGVSDARMTGGFVSCGEILERIRSLGNVRRINSGPLDGPAAVYALEGARGEIGLIGSLSRHFCESCNRLRLTADGYLRGCLFSDQETDVNTPLRQNREDSHLIKLIEDTIMNKPRGHNMLPNQFRKCVRSMNGIGG